MGALFGLSILIPILQIIITIFLFRFIFLKFGGVYTWESSAIKLFTWGILAYFIWGMIGNIVSNSVVGIVLQLIIFVWLLDRFSITELTDAKKRRMAIGIFVITDVIVSYLIQSIYPYYIFLPF